MSYLVGAGLALGVCSLATLAGFDRDRALYPTLTIVIASYYALFAVMAQSWGALQVESVVILLFVVGSLLGFKRNLWVVVAALFGHGVFDALHGRLIANEGVPTWWPQFCLAYDVVAAAYLALLLSRSRIAARNR